MSGADVETLAGLWPLVLAFMGTGALLFACGVLLGTSMRDRRATAEDTMVQWREHRQRMAAERAAEHDEVMAVARAVAVTPTGVLPVVEAAGSDLPRRGDGLPDVQDQFTALFDTLAAHGQPRVVPVVESRIEPPPPVADVDELAGSRWDTAGMYDVLPSDDDRSDGEGEDQEPPGDDDPPAGDAPVTTPELPEPGEGTQAPASGPVPSPAVRYRHAWPAPDATLVRAALLGVTESDVLRVGGAVRRYAANTRDRLRTHFRSRRAARLLRRPVPVPWAPGEVTFTLAGPAAAVTSPRLADGPGVHTRRRQRRDTRREALERTMQDTAAWTLLPLRSLSPDWRKALTVPRVPRLGGVT
jgi:hypothetical protein